MLPLPREPSALLPPLLLPLMLASICDADVRSVSMGAADPSDCDRMERVEAEAADAADAFDISNAADADDSILAAHSDPSVMSDIATLPATLRLAFSFPAALRFELRTCDSRV